MAPDASSRGVGRRRLGPLLGLHASRRVGDEATAKRPSTPGECLGWPWSSGGDRFSAASSRSSRARLGFSVGAAVGIRIWEPVYLTLWRRMDSTTLSLKELAARSLLRLSRYSVRKRVRPHVCAHLRNARRPSSRAAARRRLDANQPLGLALSRVAVPCRRARLRRGPGRRRPRS